MNWDTIWKAVLAVITAAGGFGALVLLVIKFSSNFIADKLQKKYELKLNKELEEYKSTLDEKLVKYQHISEKKNYVSKVRFDAEFAIYRELSQTFSEAVEATHGIIPDGEAYYPEDEEERKNYEKHLFVKFAKAHQSAQSTLYANAPFISKEIYDEFDEILGLIRTQSEVYNEANFHTTLSDADGDITVEDTNRTAKIDEKFNVLMNKIRDYLAKLEILEEK